MKNFIYKTNQYLLEKFPIIWNTKIVWMLCASLLLHILFFFLGYTALNNPETLQTYGAKSVFFKNGSVFINVLLSILLIVIWLFYLFKNNAFKSFYPTSKLQLFKQFICYIIIIFCASTFFISYNTGLKIYISSNYNNERFAKEITIANDAALFFSESVQDYTIDQRRYPKPFNELYCKSFVTLEEDEEDSTKNNLSFLDSKYEFYTLKTKQASANRIIDDSIYSGYVFYNTKDTLRTFYYKDSVYNIKKHIKSAYPSYFNCSKTFFELSVENTMDVDYNMEYSVENSDYNYNVFFSKKHEIRNKRNQELLKRNNPEEIKSLLNSFLSIADSYKIKHNLSAQKWFDLVYFPSEFNLKYFIRNETKSEFIYEDALTRTASEEFYKNHKTNYFIETDSLHTAFENIVSIKKDETILESIHFYIWLSFILSALIFMFRVTGLKHLLFTIITTGVLAIIITLLCFLFDYLIGSYNNILQYFALYLILFIGTVILLIPLILTKKINKIIVSIALNISFISFVLYLFLIITIISLHQRDICNLNYTTNNYAKCETLLDYLDFKWSYVLFFVNLIFIYFYCGIIKKWKSLPES